MMIGETWKGDWERWQPLKFACHTFKGNAWVSKEYGITSNLRSL